MRWWDGQIWSPHVAPGSGPPQPHYVQVPYDVGRERRLMKIALVTVVAIGLWYALECILNATALGDSYRHEIHRQFGSGTATFNFSFLSWVGIAVWLGELPFALWLRLAAIAARNAGYPARRSPNWAVWGFICPVVNLWFPYLSAVDCFLPGDPRRKIAGHWWAWWLIQGFVASAVLEVALAGRGPALIVAIVALICPAMATWFGIKLVKAISEAHTALGPQ